MPTQNEATVVNRRIVNIVKSGEQNSKSDNIETIVLSDSEDSPSMTVPPTNTMLASSQSNQVLKKVWFYLNIVNILG